jgi:hypothetical protein
MILLRIVLALACLTIFARDASAAPPVDAGQIARDPAWLALLHYRAQRDGSMHSQADRPRFFLAADGKHSPRAELDAAIDALSDPARQQDFACRFPARYEWLRTRLGQDGFDPALAQCPQLAQWIAGFPGRRISINFASSYLENPSSTFGHTFLRIFQQSGNELLSPTINFAASTDPREGSLAFMVKGLAGGFPGVADQLPFYRRLRTYAETEGRDIHEYELALAPAEVRRLILHTWEVRDGVFDYYFIDENCAYRTLALIDVARPQDGLLKQFTSATVPVDTIRVLRAAGLLGARRVWPSAPRHVRDLETQAGPRDAASARAIALGAASSAGERAGVLQLAYEYSSVLIDRDEGQRAGRKEILAALAKARLDLDEPEIVIRRAAPASPEAGHDGALLAAGMRSGRAASLEYALFQHTLTSPLPGYQAHAEIRLFNPELTVRGGHVRVQRIDWLLAQSTIPSSTLFGARAWRAHLTTRRKPFSERDHMASSVAYHAGRAWPLGADTVLSVLPGASIEASAAHADHAALAGVLNTALTRQGEQWSAQLELRAEKFIAGASLRRLDAQATGEIRLARNLSLAVSAVQTWSPRRERELLVQLKWRHRSLSAPLTFLN